MQSENPWYIATAELAEMLFPEAAKVWLETRRGYISPKTFHEYQMNIVTLSKFFGEMTLKQIGADPDVSAHAPSAMCTVRYQPRMWRAAADVEAGGALGRDRTKLRSLTTIQAETGASVGT